VTVGNLHHPGCPVRVDVLAGASFEQVYAVQERTQWCWVACAQMVLKQLEMLPIPKQCEIACRSKRFGDADCCGSTEACNSPCSMAHIEQVYCELGVTCTGLEKPIDESQLIKEIFAERPVQIGFTYANATVGHVVLVIGEKTLKKTGQKWLHVADPREMNGKQTLPFDEVKTDSGKGTWIWTWLYMKRKDP